MSRPTSNRQYSAEEATAFKAAGLNASEGPAQFAGGDWWPNDLEVRAIEAEMLVPKLRLAAAALRREIATDPRTGPVGASLPDLNSHKEQKGASNE